MGGAQAGRRGGEAVSGEGLTFIIMLAMCQAQC